MGNKYLKIVLCTLIFIGVIALIISLIFNIKTSNSSGKDANDEGGTVEKVEGLNQSNAEELLELDIKIEDFYLKKTGDPSNFYYIDDENVLWGSGRNEYGQLGQGTQDYEFYEDAVKLAENVVHVTFSQKGFVIYLTNDNKLYGVGNAGCGALQQYAEFDWNKYVNEEDYCIAKPVLLMEDVVYACCGKDDVVCLKKDGTVWTWGTVFVQGNSSTHNAYYIQQPKEILQNALLVTGGWFNHAALLQDGTVWTWGYNSSGNCGVANSSVVKEPSMVATDVVMVWTDLAATLESPTDGTIRAGKTQYNVDYERITEFEGEYPYFLNNTVIKKSDGTYWICGENVGTEEKVVHGAEADYTVICTHEFQMYEVPTDKVNEQTERNPENILSEDKVSIAEQCLTMDQIATDTEKNEIINIISNLPEEDYNNAIEYDKNSRELIEGDHLVVITSNESGDITIYGYKGSKYDSRGIIVDNKGVKSYFDYSWNEQRERRKIYEADFDQDGIDEIAFVLMGSYGSGVSVERLIVFDQKDENGQFIAYELTDEILQQEMEKISDFQVDIGNWEVIIKKNNTVEKVIDWKKSSQYYVDGEFKLDYLNQIKYEILGDKIIMSIEVGIWTNKDGPQTYFQNNAGTLNFNVIYENKQYILE